MSKEHPLLYTTDMIRSLLAGKKTMTRRILTKRNSTCGSLLTGDGQGWHSFDFNDVVVDGKEGNSWYLKVAVPENETRHRIFPKWDVGDLIWVRETWAIICYQEDCNCEGDNCPHCRYEFKADTPYAKYAGGWSDEPDEVPKGCRWKPSIHMPKVAARIWLEITEITVERIQDITEDDAIAEGIDCYWDEVSLTSRFKDYLADARGYGHPDHDYPTVHDPRESFKTLWIKINGEEKWNSNPWVWIIQFKTLSTTGKPSLV